MKELKEQQSLFEQKEVHFSCDSCARLILIIASHIIIIILCRLK